jgi:outer membrane receptor protein involved in Fe transport
MNYCLSKNFKLSLIAQFIGAITCSAAYAGGEQTLERVTVVANANNPIGYAETASEGTITAQQLEHRPLARPGEVLETIPGLIVTQHSGTGKANQFFLRGFNLDHGTDFRTSFAGVPINFPTHGHGQGYTDVNFLIPELIGKIAYKKGTYYAEEGDFSAAGAANIDYVNRLDDALLQLQGGRFGYARALFANSANLGRGTLTYAFEGAKNDGPWDVKEDLKKANAFVRYVVGETSNQFRVTGIAFDNRWIATDQVPERAIASGLINRFGSLGNDNGGKTSRYQLSADWQRIDDKSVTTANVYAVDYKLNLFSNFTYFLDDPEQGDQFEQADRRNVFGFKAEHSRNFNWGGVSGDNAIGLEARHDRIGNVGLYRTIARERIWPVREDRVNQTSYSIYAKNTTRWSPWLRTTAGIRSDHYDFKVNSSLADNSGKRSENIVSPKFTAAFGPWAKTEFYAAYGYGFHSNDARGSTITIDPSTGDPADKADPLVRAKGAEFGIRSQPLPGLQLAASVWQLNLASELLFVGDAGTTEASRPSRRQGSELALYYKPNKHLVIDADMAFTRARFRDSALEGNRIPGAIERTASLGIHYDTEKWFAAGRLRYFGARPLVEDNSVRSRPSTLVNLNAGYKITPKMSLSLEVLNVFDKKSNDIEYFYESRLRDELDPVADKHIHPSEPRSFRLIFNMKF